MDNIFERARSAVTRTDIELMFGPGRWEGDEFWCRNPLRADAHEGSFSIKSNGLYFDFASNDKGDFIDLVAKARGIEPIQAARLILRESEPETRPTAPKVPPQPHPNSESYERAVSAFSSSRKITPEWGKPTLKTHYYNDAGQAIFSIIRYERLRSGVHEKTIRQVYYGTDEKLHIGLPYPNNRPLWNLLRLKAKPEAPVLVVEGEKCAEAGQRALPGYVVMTWCGGAQAIDKTDWTPLLDRKVTIWPDHDSAGHIAALKIHDKLGNAANILDIPDSKPQGWDIADCIAEGLSPLDFIRGHKEDTSVPYSAASPDSPTKNVREIQRSYTPLGFDEKHHYFLLNDSRVIMTIERGRFTRSQIIELARPSEWGLRGGLSSWTYDEKFGYESAYTTKSGGIKQDAIQVLLLQESNAAGAFDAENMRGVGVWKDEHGKIVVHDGASLKSQDGQEIPLDQSGKYKYIFSSGKCENYFGAATTAAEGQELEELLSVLPFQNKTAAVLATGWALISNFAGCLPWRPHIWITGPSGSGKSTMILDRIIRPLVGNLSFNGSAETTKAATRRGLKNDCRPAIFDEFEPNNTKTRQSMDDILRLARNSSVDSSGESKIVSEDGKVDTYYTRSCFCFASINMMDTGKAIDSRITPIEIRPMPAKQRIENKSKLVQLDRFIEKNADKLRRRIFQNLHLILEDIQFIKDEMRLDGNSDRQIDQLAPMLAAFYAMTHDELGNIHRDSIDLMVFVRAHIQQIEESIEEVESDEDIVIHKILAHVEHTININSIGQLIEQTVNNAGTESARTSHDALKKLGLHITFSESHEPIYLHIYPGSDPLKNIFRDTHLYNFKPQLRRHPLVVAPRGFNVKMAGGTIKAYRFRFKEFYERYLSEPEEEPIPDPGNNSHAA